MSDDRNRRLLLELETERLRLVTRRHFLGGCATGLGAIFLGVAAHAQQAQQGRAKGTTATGAKSALSFDRDPATPLAPLPPQFAAKAKRVIYLHMAGAPSQLELFDHKPDLVRLDGQDCPPSFLEGKRFAFIAGVPKMLGPTWPFHQAGKSGAWLSDRLPHIERHVDDICFIKSMRTEQFNHAPAQMLLQTGSA